MVPMLQCPRKGVSALEELTGLQQALDASGLLCGTDIAVLKPTLKTFPSGERILDRLDGDPAVGLILSGRISVASDAADRKLVQMRTLGCGDCFGIANLFSDEPVSTILRCETETGVAFIRKSTLIRLIETDGAFALRYARFCSTRLQFLIRRVELLSTQSHQMRLAAWLAGQKEDAVRFPGTRDILAAHLGMSRAALFRELAQLEKKGLITTRGTLVTILDREGLQTLLTAGNPQLSTDDLPV